MRHESTAPLRFTTARGGVCVADGYGLRLYVKHGHLHVCDGQGRNRRERIYSRVKPGIARMVVLGHTGYITFEALRWLADLGIGFAQIDSDGRLLTTSTPGPDDARLRRMQALALTDPVGIEIARTILRDKLDGQREVLRHLDAGDSGNAFEVAARKLDEAGSTNELLLAERDAALAYWSVWSDVTARFRPAEATRLPAHWQRFGQRGSPLTSAPRLAVNPPNALLNYLYAILEAETRIACLTMGLDPTLGIIHADYRARDSLALDLMEAIRPNVDRYVLDLVRSRVFRKSDFYETRRGVCRILPPLTHQLSQTGPTWGTLIAPIVEHVAEVLSKMPAARVSRLATPLTNSKRQAARDRVRKRTRSQQLAIPKPPPACRGCGGEVPHAERAYCNDCLPDYERQQFENFSGTGLAAIERRKKTGHDPTHGGEAAERRGRSTTKRKGEIRRWEREFGRLHDLTVFEEKILPTIADVSLSRLVRATGLSLRYVSQIRRGERVPHPRHWDAIAKAGADADQLRTAAQATSRRSTTTGE